MMIERSRLACSLVQVRVQERVRTVDIGVLLGERYSHWSHNM